MVVFIQARSNSKRFPNKVLKEIYDHPMILHVVNRVKKSKFMKKVIVATSKKKSDDKLVGMLKKNKINFFRGELNNVASRFLELAKRKKLKYFMRVSGDSPLIDPKIIDRASIIKKKFKNADIITNVFPRSYPKGMSVEIIKVSTLRNNIEKMKKNDLEHVTKYFYRNYKKFNIINFKNISDKKTMKFSIDTKNDLKKIINKIKKDNFYNFKI